MEWNKTSFADYDCIRLTNESLTLWITHSVGPRIIGLTIGNNDNLLAVVPEASAETPGGKRYRFRGGHRLWHAPEDPERTYVPDDEPVSVSAVSQNTLTFTQPVEVLTGIQKRITVSLPDNSPKTIIEHTLTNNSEAPVELAAWAITQFRPGGFAILPMPQEETGLLPNRRLSLWPYTKINSPHLQLGDKYVFVHATMETGKLKIGWANPVGWLGYAIDDILFVKRAPFHPNATYYDFGSSSECYCDPHFLELETLGPKTIVEPGGSVSHTETWELYENISLEAEESAVQQTFAHLAI